MDFEELNKAASQEDGPTRIDRALDKFANMMIERLEACKTKNWEQGWTSGDRLVGLPQNINGRPYVGGNAFLLQMHTMIKGYHVPVYMTSKQARDNGALIKKGEASVPVFKWGLSVKDENGKRISEDKYLAMDKEDQAKCQVRPYLMVYNEWNLDQTTLEEVNKKKYDAIISRFKPTTLSDDVGMYKNEPLDRMFEKQEWVCPIQVNQEVPGASYNKTRDFIKVPMKAQFKIHEGEDEIFKDGQEYYSSALHEMAHSTGHPSRLDRLPKSKFGSEEYAKEELVAETTAFVIGNALGFSSRISDNNAAYIDSWIQTLREKPKFITTLMSDVNKASRMILEEIDKQKVALGEKPLMEGNLDGIEEQIKNEEQLEKIKQQNVMKEENVSDSITKPLSSPEAYFSSLMTQITYDKDSEHTVLALESLPELRAYFQDNEVLGNWIEEVSDEKLFSLGASLLPNIKAQETVDSSQNIDNNMKDSNEEGKTSQDSVTKPKNEYYFSYLYLQSVDNTQEFDDLSNKEKWDELLTLTQQYDQGDSLSQHDTRKNATSQCGDDLLVENDHYALVYNNSLGGTYELLRRVSEEDIKLSIEQYGLENDASQDVKAIAQDMVQKELETIKANIPAFSMPNGDVLYFEYNKEKDSLNVGTLTNIGLSVHHSFPYDHSAGLDKNLQNVEEQLSEMPEYQIHEEENEEVEDSVADTQLQDDYASIAKKFSEQINPAYHMPNGEILDFQYDPATNLVQVGKKEEGAFKEVYSQAYNVNLSMAENMTQIYKVLAEKDEYKFPLQNETPHEDSNIQTDVVGVAEQIEATGVPMHEAEKEAKTVVDDEQHVKYHEEKAQEQETQKHQEDNEEVKKEDKASVESDHEDKEEKKSESKAASHAALLLAALEMAKSHEGVWMNEKGKSNAEFLASKKPITAFNNIMMNLHSDQQGYKTNLYSTYNQAKESGMSVKRGQSSLPFNWIKWEYQNVTDHNDTISREEYNALPDMEKSNYAVHAHRQRHHVYNIDQTILSASDAEQYSALLKEKGQKIEKFVETAKNASSPQSALQFIKDQEQKHPEVVVFIKKGSSYEIYGDKAKTIAPVIGIQAKEKEIDGKKTSYLSFPSYALDTVLPKVIRAGNRVAICDNLQETKISKDVAPATKILSHAYKVADAVCKASGIKNERVHVLQDAKFDSKENTLFISGISKTEGNEQVNAVMKANDIFRSVVATTGDAKRLDRSGRNSLLPADDAKHELLIRELSAGVLMARQGLPATLSKESQQLIPYWERELRENVNLMGMIERDVNNAIETIDKLVDKREVNYDAIRGQLPTKDVLLTGKDYSISADLNKLPSMETKEMVVVLDRKQQTADVILPSGASLLVNNEVQGMSKKRIGIALKKEDVKEVSFYNAGGILALKEPNSYYKDKEVTVSKLKQFTLEIHQTIDVSSQLTEKQATKIEKFQAIQDSEGKYAFFIKPENEKSFSIYPMKEHLNAYFNVMGKDNKQEMHQALAQKYYDIGYRYPESRQQLIVPNTEGIDMSRIEKVRICADKDDPKVKVVIATVDGERMQKPISKQQWYNLWLADDMAEYKKAVAAVTFIPQIQQTAGNNQQQVLENEGRNVAEKEPGEKEDSQQEASSHRGFHR